MSDKILKVGYARVNINPPMGIDVTGYYKVRKADGILDDLEIVATAFNQNGKTILIISVDNCGIKKEVINEFKAKITERTGVPAEAIYIHTTHTHTGPRVYPVAEDQLQADYKVLLFSRIADVAQFAIEDLKPAKMGYGVGEAKKVAFIRRYKMKDGTTKTNPGVNNPDIVAPVGELDESVNVVRFDREGAETVVLVNFANHPDVVGGNKISSDWPGLTRRFVEKAIDNTKCIFLNGAQGDVNHVNVHPTKGDFNDMFNDFDGCSRGYGHARHIARVVTGAVLSVYDKVEYVDVDDIKYSLTYVQVPVNKADPKDLPLAHKYNDLHLAGRDDEIPFKAMMLTTVVAEAIRMVRLENEPEFYNLPFGAVAIGKVALFGIPGEPFNAIGRGIKEANGWDMIIPTCNTNGSEGYYPMQDSYDEGGYEARTSTFKAGTAEKIIADGVKILDGMRK
ncbi:MAG: hypothetical protein IJX03_01370 [Clostridia bacterium]|nr:hypothetical protein [Clostridia bacterium]